MRVESTSDRHLCGHQTPTCAITYDAVFSSGLAAAASNWPSPRTGRSDQWLSSCPGNRATLHAGHRSFMKQRPQDPELIAELAEIGRASCRERVETAKSAV